MLGQAELIHRPHLRVDDSEDEIDPEPLPNDTGAEATKVRRVGEVGIALLSEMLFL